MRWRTEKIGTPRKPVEAVQIKTDGLWQFQITKSLVVLEDQIEALALHDL
jgi:hypothetical protein